WQGNAGTPYAGKTYVSMTGTEGLADFATDYDLAIAGAPLDQMVDLAQTHADRNQMVEYRSAA
ncbi:MAG: hypothetical protein WCD07_02760, partial [Burkholderiales bacterium]